jgi:uncharacterized protein involved in high-affinity Fe2+ transport
MKFRKTPFALAALALCSPLLPLSAQTTSMTIEAESMALSSYAIEGSRIKLTSSNGTATKTFSGASGTYNMQVHVVLENDGRPTLEVHKGNTRLHTYTYPLGTTTATFNVNNVVLASGESIKLLGRADAGAWARVDKIVLTQVATSTSAPAPSTGVVLTPVGTSTPAPTTGYSGTPYSGTPVALPKAFEAVNFDKGGQGVAYRDLTAGNAGGVYRTAEDVDIIASTDSQGGAYAVNNFQTGEWLAYTVNVPANGNYDLAIRAASNQTTPAAFHIEVDGVNVTGSIAVPKTSTWATFQWVGKQNVPLTAGKRVLKVVSEQQYFNVNAVSVLASPVAAPAPAPAPVDTSTPAPAPAPQTSTPYSGTPIALPKAFEAVNFDKGGQGVAYRDLTAGNAGGVYRTAEDVDIVTSTDSQGGAYAVNNFQTGEWLAYTVNVPANGNYDLAIRAASNQTTPAAFHIEVDGVNVTGSIAVPKTTNWSTFQWVGKQSVPLTAGTRVVKVVSEQQYFNMNAISVLASTVAAPAPAPGDTTTPAPGDTSTPVPAPVDTSTPAPAPITSACANPSAGYEGFGRNTSGGAGKPVYRVTNLNDSGAGSLRDALSQGNRCVVFDVGGTISLSSDLVVRGANVTIDGFTAPSPGITLRNRTLVMQGSSGAGNVVLRGIRSRGTSSGLDAIRVYNASNIVIDRVSVSGFGDGAIDVTERARDVTIQWSILGNGMSGHNFPSLIKYNASRVTVHHNLYVNGDDRNPHCGGSDGATSLMPEIVCDVRNNLIWNYKYYGTAVKTYGTANVVNNYYYTTNGSTAGNTIYLAGGGSAYVSGNYSRNGWDLNAHGNSSTPYAAVVPATTDAITAAQQVLAQAGARGPRFGLDAADQSSIGQISLTLNGG